VRIQMLWLTSRAATFTTLATNFEKAVFDARNDEGQCD
jgi:hypothetical protein